MSSRVKVEIVTVPGKVLEGNPLGDPARREMPVLLPPGYGEDEARRYPALYALTGFAGRGAGLLNIDPWQPNLAQRLERLYAEGMPHAVVALPDCFTLLGGSQYINSPAVGRYEDYVVDEVVPFVDTHFRTIPEAEARGVFGKSSGGYGALRLGMIRPDVFGGVACHSGDMYFELCHKPDFPRFCNTVNRAGGLSAWWEGFQGKIKKSSDDFATLNILAMSACYSPDKEGFMGIGLPVDLYTCKLREEVWAQWLEWDPLTLAPSYADNLLRLRLLYMDCGTRDEHGLHFGARILSQMLKEMDVPHVHEEFDDVHGSTQYRYSVSLPMMMEALQSS